jgi:phosphoribosylformylglycinamidine synthase
VWGTRRNARIHVIDLGVLIGLKNAEAKVQELLPGVLNSEASSVLTKKPGELAEIYYITPRNISPWSSKATSIAWVCGLKTQVQRIERGRAILVRFAENGRSVDVRVALRQRAHGYP